MLTRPDPTRQNPAKSWPDPTRPDPRVHPTRGQLWSSYEPPWWGKIECGAIHECESKMPCMFQKLAYRRTFDQATYVLHNEYFLFLWAAILDPLTRHNINNNLIECLTLQTWVLSSRWELCSYFVYMWDKSTESQRHCFTWHFCYGRTRWLEANSTFCLRDFYLVANFHIPRERSTWVN